MTLEEAIKHAEEKADELRNEAEHYKTAGVNIYGCEECAKEHDQFAEWLKELKQIREQLKWIPVSERLPHKGEYGKVLVTYIPSGGTLWTTVIIAHYSDLMGIAKPSFHIGEVGKESFQNITEQVIAWMSLPGVYKAEMRNEE